MKSSNVTYGFKVVAFLQTSGALFGLAILAIAVAKAGSEIDTMVAFTAAMLAAACVLGAYFGVLLWQGNSFGRMGSIFIQGMQIPAAVTPAVSYKVFFGFALYIDLLERSPLFNMNIGAVTMLYLFPRFDGFDASINVVPIFALLFLTRRDV